MPNAIERARSRLDFIPQRFNPLVYHLARISLPILLRFRTRPWLPAGIAQVETANVEILVDLYQKFQAGKIRFLMAFRHPEVDDPLCMMYLFSRAIPQVARQRGISLQLPIHSHFIYDRGMTLWAGNWLGWLFSRLGGFPIHRGKSLDLVGLRMARELFANGRLPLTVAPEGATNGHSEVVSPLEPGVAQLSLWCAADLLKANRFEEVFIVPIGIKYRYIHPPWTELDRLLSQLEADTGLPVQPIELSVPGERERAFSARLCRLSDRVLTLMEEFYRRWFHYHHPTPIPVSTESSANRPQLLTARLQSLLHVALQAGEQYFGLPPEGTAIDRCRRLEEAGWNDIYREDLPDLQALSAFERGLADWIAQEAELRMRHMRQVETFVAVTATYVLEKPTVERFAEMSLLLFDLIARIKGQKHARRPRLGWRRALLTVGEPISVSDRLSVYQSSRQAARQAVQALTQDLQTRLGRL